MKKKRPKIVFSDVSDVIVVPSWQKYRPACLFLSREDIGKHDFCSVLLHPMLYNATLRIQNASLGWRKWRVLRENCLFSNHVEIIFGLLVFMLYRLKSIFTWEWTKSRIKPIWRINSSSIAEWSLASEIFCFPPCQILMKARSKFQN